MTEVPGIEVEGRPLVAGTARARLLRLTHPISFWGGVDPTTGRIVDPRHPEYEFSIAGTILVIPSAVGSSSSSAIMLELLREGTAPAAILMGKADAILALGCVVAQELGYDPVPMVEIAVEELERLPDGLEVTVHPDGRVTAGQDEPEG